MATTLRLVLVFALVVAACCQTTKNTTKPAASTAQNGMADDHSGHMGHDHGGGMAHGGSMQGNMTKALPVPDSCVKDPKQGNCSTFDYPHANAVNDVQRLCAAMSFMTACSVSKACAKAGAGPDAPTGPGAATVSKNNPDVCRPFTHLATVCSLDTGMSRMAGCDNFRSMCVDGSPVPKCKRTGNTALPTTSAVNTQVRSICEANAKGEGCAECMTDWSAGKKWANCDLLATYSGLCGKDPSLSQCVEFHNMCRADSSLVFCKSYDDKAKKAADGVLKNKGADPESKQATGPTAGKSAAAASSVHWVLVVMAGAAALLAL